MFLFLVVFSEKDPGIEIAQGNIIFVLTFRINEASSFLSFRFFKLRKFLCIIEVLITVASFRIDETENKRVTKRTNRDEACVPVGQNITRTAPPFTGDRFNSLIWSRRSAQ